MTATFHVGDAIETPWHHVHIEYDEATGGYSYIEFCEVAYPSGNPYDESCPTCGAQPSEPCWDRRFATNPEPVGFPHKSRLALARAK